MCHQVVLQVTENDRNLTLQEFRENKITNGVLSLDGIWTNPSTSNLATLLHKTKFDSIPFDLDLILQPAVDMALR